MISQVRAAGVLRSDYLRWAKEIDREFTLIAAEINSAMLTRTGGVVFHVESGEPPFITVVACWYPDAELWRGEYDERADELAEVFCAEVRLVEQNATNLMLLGPTESMARAEQEVGSLIDRDEVFALVFAGLDEVDQAAELRLR